MLVLSRHISQSVILLTPEGRRIVVMLADVRGPDKARLAFQADPDVVILREELEQQGEWRKAKQEGHQ